MTNDFRDKILATLGNNFTAEQLNMIDMAIAKSLRGYKIEAEETLPSTYIDYIPVEINEFLARKKLKGCASGTIDQYKYVVYDFFDWLRRDVKEVRDIDILAYLDYVYSKGSVSQRTLDNKRLILSSFYTYMHDTGKIPYNPTKTVDKIKYVEKVREPLTNMELERVRNACKTPREKAIIEVLYSTGARVSEIARINHTDINFDNGSVCILGKGSYERLVFFTPRAIIAIEEYLKIRKDNNPALFVGSVKPYNRLTKSSIESIVREIGKKSGIGKNVFPHLFRHTFATDLLYRGAKINEVSKLLGHHKLETTKINAKTNIDSLYNSHRMYIS